MKDAELNGGSGGNVSINLENYLRKDEGVLKDDFQKLEGVVNGKASADHKHGIGEVKNLQEYLLQKSEVGHKHSIGDVSGLDERLKALEDGTSGDDDTVRINTELTVPYPNIPTTFKWDLCPAAKRLNIFLDGKHVIDIGRNNPNEENSSMWLNVISDIINIEGSEIGINGVFQVSSDNIIYVGGKIESTAIIEGTNVKSNNEIRLASVEIKLAELESKSIATMSVDNGYEERLALLERVNVQQQNEINSLKETLANHVIAIETIANKLGIEVEK